MKNFVKKFVTCIIATCIIAATALAAACDTGSGTGGGENHTDPTLSGYTIKVLYPDNTPVKGSDGPSSRQTVGIQLVDSEGKDINGAYSVVSEYGTATIPYYQSGEFFIDVINCPRGYGYKDTVTTTKGRGDYTVKLSSINVSYTINVKLPDGNPASGVTVTISNSISGNKSAVTGSDGKAVFDDVEAGTYTVDFNNLPDGVSYLPTKLTSSTTTLNVDLISLRELKLDTVMSPEKLAEWDKVANYYDEDGSDAEIIRFNTKAECYDFTTDTIPEGKKIYYYFTADKDGEYRFISKGKYYTVEFYGSKLGDVQMTTKSEHESTNTCEMVPLELKAGRKYYFSYSIPARVVDTDNPDTHELTGTREFMIAKPVAGTKTHEANGAGSYNIDFETDTALLVFNTPENANPGNPLPTEGGVFEIRSNTNLYDVKLEYYAYYNQSSNKLPDEVADDISETDKNFLFTISVPPSFAGNKYYFKIIIKSKLDGGEVEYPTTVPITITRTGNAEENVSPVEYQHATATAKYAEQTGKTFHYLIGDNKTIKENNFTIVQKDGGYFVNIDGTEYELVVAIKKNLPKLPYSYATVEYMGDNGTGEDDSVDQSTETRQNNYLSLYDDPAKGEDKNNTKLNYTPFIEEYATICNSDGVYALNTELKNFLIKYYEHHWHDFGYVIGFENQSDCCWLLSCGYYA